MSIQLCDVEPRAGIARRQLRPRPAVITTDDRRGLGTLIASAEYWTDPQAIGEFEARLEDAVYLERDELPQTIVAMNSTVELLDLGTNERRLATLVFPEEAEHVPRSVSVLDPLGTALLGSAEGSVIPCRERRDMVHFKILEVIQMPEPPSVWRRGAAQEIS